MTNIELVREKLKALEEYVSELEKCQNLTVEQLKSSKRDLWAVAHGLQISIECILDIGNHIIADDKLGNPTNYREIIEILGREGVIPLEFGKELKDMPGFRNILIHEYLKVDVEKVHQNLQKAPTQFQKFIGFINHYIE